MAEPHPRLPDYLGHMFDAVRSAIDYVSETSESAFLSDRKTQQSLPALHGQLVALMPC